MARSALAEAKINTNPTQPARSRAPAVPDTCPSPGQREARPGVAGDARESVRDTAGGSGDGMRDPDPADPGRRPGHRNSADYAAALMLGHDLANFCAQPGVQSASHPEIRAELCFGLDNSTGMPSPDAMENLRHFQDQDWRVSEQDIIAAREEVARTRPPSTEQLAAAPHEVAAVDAAW